MTEYYFTIKNEVKAVGVDTTKVFDGQRDVSTATVPGHDKETYVCWGDDDQLPYKMQAAVASDEVLSGDKLTNVQTCYGAGLQLMDKKTKEETEDDNIQDWIFRNDLASFFLNQCTDMKYYFWTVALLILSADKKTINRIIHKDVCYCRLEKTDEDGNIRHLYYGDFREGAPEKVERLEILNLSHTFDDIRQQIQESKEKKFAIVMRYPTAGCNYYPDPYWTASLRGGSYDEKKMIMKAKLAKLKNFTSVRYHIEINDKFFDRIFEEEGATDPEEQQKIRDEQIQKINDFCTGAENANKIWITKCYEVDGKVVNDVIINRLDNPKEGGDWETDVQSAVNTMCFADNVHPNLVGAVPGKSQTNNSGSDKRELFTMKQAMEISFHDILLRSIQVVIKYNGWKNIKPTVPMIQLTTLDEHRDSKKVNSEGEEI